MSDIATFCAAVVSDLQTNVAGLSTANIPSDRVHQLVPWDPAELSALAGERHLAIWPAAEQIEVVEPLANTVHELHQSYVVLCWEDASAESSRAASDAAATTTFVDLFEAARARFYVEANQSLGASELLWYAGASWPESIGSVRWWAIRLDRRIDKAFT